jgi:hypothetical protein
MSVLVEMFFTHSYQPGGILFPESAGIGVSQKRPTIFKKQGIKMEPTRFY